MTDRFGTLTVVLESDIREDDAEQILNAIRQIRGVLCVEGNIKDQLAYLAHSRVRAELADKLWKILYPGD